MYRKDQYATYNGKEYRIVRTRKNELFLISNDDQDVKKGFKKYAEGVYEKKINESEITDVFYIYSVAEYKGHEFEVVGSKGEDTVIIGTSNAEIAEELEFSRTDKYYYEKIVSIELVNIYEKREKASM